MLNRDSHLFDRAWASRIRCGGYSYSLPPVVYEQEAAYRYVGELGYYTHYQIPSFGLLELGVRFYDPEIGRFTERDAVRVASNSSAYAYAQDKPLYLIDPAGNLPRQCHEVMSYDECLKMVDRWYEAELDKIDDYEYRRRNDIHMACLIACGIALPEAFLECMTVCELVGQIKVDREVRDRKIKLRQERDERRKSCEMFPKK